MKSLNLLVALASLILIIGCDETEEFDDGGYSTVYPGILIYSQARTTNDLTLDALSVAVRFAILRSEMESEGLSFEQIDVEPDWSTMGNIEYRDKEYNKKEFLFGDDSSVEIVKSAENQYSILFGDITSASSTVRYGRGVYDQYYRTGGYTITIDEVTTPATWSVSRAEDGMGIARFSSYGEVAGEFVAKHIAATITFDDDKIGFEVATQFNRNDTGSLYSDWHCEGQLTIADYVDMSLESTIDNNWSLNITSLTEGVSLWGTELSYQTTTPLLYNPSISYLTEISGSERAIIYNNSSYPSPSVLVERFDDGSRRVSYNGATYYY